MNEHANYSLAPNGPRQRRGIIKLVNDIEQLVNYDYDNLRLAITGNDTQVLIAYKSNPSVNNQKLIHNEQGP